MTTDLDLRDALTLAAGPGESAASEPAGDLARAQQAARVRRRRRFRLAVSGLTTAAVVAVLVSGVTSRVTSDSPTAVDDRVTLVAGPLAVAPYVFDRVPEGWEVQGQSPTALTIAPSDGSVSADPDVFVGKLVVMYDQQALHGDPVELDGRTFFVAEGGDDYTTVSVRTTDSEPRGVVRVQYPVDAGWRTSQMLEFLAGVTVTDEARPGVG